MKKEKIGDFIYSYAGYPEKLVGVTKLDSPMGKEYVNYLDRKNTFYKFSDEYQESQTTFNKLYKDVDYAENTKAKEWFTETLISRKTKPNPLTITMPSQYYEGDQYYSVRYINSPDSGWRIIPNEEQNIPTKKHDFEIGNKVKVKDYSVYMSKEGNVFQVQNLQGMEGIVKKDLGKKLLVDIHGRNFKIPFYYLEKQFDYIQANPDFMNRSDDFDLFPDQDKRVY